MWATTSGGAASVAGSAIVAADTIVFEGAHQIVTLDIDVSVAGIQFNNPAPTGSGDIVLNDTALSRTVTVGSGGITGTCATKTSRVRIGTLSNAGGTNVVASGVFSLTIFCETHNITASSTLAGTSFIIITHTLLNVPVSVTVSGSAVVASVLNGEWRVNGTWNAGAIVPTTTVATGQFADTNNAVTLTGSGSFGTSSSTSVSMSATGTFSFGTFPGTLAGTFTFNTGTINTAGITAFAGTVTLSGATWALTDLQFFNFLFSSGTFNTATNNATVSVSNIFAVNQASPTLNLGINPVVLNGTNNTARLNGGAVNIRKTGTGALGFSLYPTTRMGSFEATGNSTISLAGLTTLEATGTVNFGTATLTNTASKTLRANALQTNGQTLANIALDVDTNTGTRINTTISGTTNNTAGAVLLDFSDPSNVNASGNTNPATGLSPSHANILFAMARRNGLFRGVVC